MRDSCGRMIDYMRVSVTDRCNLRCKYCMPAEGVPMIPEELLLTDAEILRIVQVAAKEGICDIKVTGGEPLLRGNIVELIGCMKQTPGIRRVTLTTNGIRLPSVIEGLKQAGLDGVNISLDSLDEERYREITRGGELSGALEGLRRALKEPSFIVKVNAVLEESHWKEDARSLAKLAVGERVAVRFIEHIPLGAGGQEKAVLEQDILHLLREDYGEPEVYKEAIGAGPGHYVTFPGMRGQIGFISAMSHKFCSGCNRVRLTADGNLRLCLQSREGISLRERLRAGADDEELARCLREGIRRKPKEHKLTEQKIEAEGMCQIGG